MADYSSQQNLEAMPWSAPSPSEAPYRRTGRTKDDLLKRYRQRLDIAARYRQQKGVDATWTRMLDLYRGKHYTDVDSDSIVVNVSFSTINVIVPSVSVNHPTITVEARHEYHDANAAIAQAVVNYWWRHYDWRKETAKAVKDSLIYGIGWAKVCWKYETEEQPLSDEEVQQAYDEQVLTAQSYAAQNPELAGSIPTDEEILAGIPETKRVPVIDEPRVERVSPWDIQVDPEATCVSDLKWIAQRIVVPLEDVKKNESYVSAVRKRTKPDAGVNVSRGEDGREKDKRDKDDIERVTIWEFYDLQHDLMCVFAQNARNGDFLVEPTPFPYPFGQPFVPLFNYDVPDQFYPIGELEMLEPLQHELNKTRTMMMNHRKRWNRKYVANSAAFSVQARQALESDRDNEIAWVDGDFDLGTLMAPVQQIPLAPELYNYSEQIEADIELVSGISEYQRGALSETRRTATEASIIQDASNARTADKLTRVEDFVREVAERVVQLAQEHIEGEQYARIVGPDSMQLWVPFTREDIQGEFDFEVEAGSTQPRNELFRRQQALQLAQALGPYVGMVVNPQELVRFVLKDGFGVRNPARFLLVQQPIDPLTGQPLQQGPVGDMGGGIEDSMTLPESGPGAIPPNVLTQLQGQVGLDLDNQG